MMITNRGNSTKKVVLPWWNKNHCPFLFPLEIPVEWTHFLPPLVNRISHELERYYIKQACWKHHHSAVSTKPNLFCEAFQSPKFMHQMPHNRFHGSHWHFSCNFFQLGQTLLCDNYHFAQHTVYHCFLPLLINWLQTATFILLL